MLTTMIVNLGMFYEGLETLSLSTMLVFEEFNILANVQKTTHMKINLNLMFLYYIIFLQHLRPVH